MGGGQDGDAVLSDGNGGRRGRVRVTLNHSTGGGSLAMAGAR
jgi:hypothetical protein